MTKDEDAMEPAAELMVETRVLEPGITAVTVAGSIGPYNANHLRNRLFEEIDSGSVHLVLELDGLEYLDSTGLGTLIGAFKKVRQQNGSIHLVGMTERVGKILRITGLGNVLPTAPSVDAAIERIRAPDLQTPSGEEPT